MAGLDESSRPGLTLSLQPGSPPLFDPAHLLMTRAHACQPWNSHVRPVNCRTVILQSTVRNMVILFTLNHGHATPLFVTSSLVPSSALQQDLSCPSPRRILHAPYITLPSEILLPVHPLLGKVSATRRPRAPPILASTEG